MLFSSTTTPGQTSAMSSSLVTNWPWRFTSISRTSNARWPSVTGTPWASSSRRATSNRNGPNAKASVIASLRRRWPRFNESQREPIAAVAAFVIHAACETAHQMDAEITHFRLLERSRHRRRRSPRGIELPAVVLDPGDQSSSIALELDRDLEPIAPCGAVHDDIGDGLFETKLHGERNIRRHALLREAFKPPCQPLQFGNVVAQHQSSCFEARHRFHDANAAVAAASVWWIGMSASIPAVLRTLATLLSGHRMTRLPPLLLTILAPTKRTRMP